MKSQSYLCWAN